MTTLTQTCKTRKPNRTLRLYPGSPALLEMAIGPDTFSYWLRPLAAEQGQAFELRKSISDGGEAYHVLLHGPAGHSCECKGHLRWGHRTLCKHVASLLALIEQGKIAAPPAQPQPVAQPAPTQPSKPAPVRPAVAAACPVDIQDF
jgi:hypothetical protein